MRKAIFIREVTKTMLFRLEPPLIGADSENPTEYVVICTADTPDGQRIISIFESNELGAQLNPEGMLARVDQTFTPIDALNSLDFDVEGYVE